MANELMAVEFESLSGVQVKLDAQTVRSTLTRGNGKITDQEVAMFLRTCQAKRLDPLEAGEVYLIKYGDSAPASMVVGYHAYVRRAERNPDYRGYKAGVVVIRGNNPEPIFKEGAAVYKQIGEILIGGWCKVFRAFGDRIDETYAEVSMDEYNTGKSNWNNKPATMIRKCAIAQAFRGAFPNDYEGLYTEDEMVASGAIPANYTEMPSASAPVVNEPPTMIDEAKKGQLINYIIKNFGSQSGAEILRNICVSRGINSPDKIPSTDFESIMDELARMKSESAVKEAVNDGFEPIEDDVPYEEEFMQDNGEAPPFA